MTVTKFTNVLKKYKKCPNCGTSWKENKLVVTLENEEIKISCDCGFLKVVDENNKEIK